MKNKFKEVVLTYGSNHLLKQKKSRFSVFYICLFLLYIVGFTTHLYTAPPKAISLQVWDAFPYKYGTHFPTSVGRYFPTNVGQQKKQFPTYFFLYGNVIYLHQ